MTRVKDLRGQVVRRDATGIPEQVRDDAMARAFYGCVRESIVEAGATPIESLDSLSANAAQHFVGIVHTHRRVDWAGNPDVENAIKNDMDDYVFDVIRSEHGVVLSTEAIDGLIDKLLRVARRQGA